MTAPVAQLRYLTRATRNSAENAQPDAQPATGQIPRKPLSAKELRAHLRAQPERNQAIQAVATVAPVVAHLEHLAGPPDVQRKAPATSSGRERVLAILDANPDLQRAVITDSEGDPDGVVVTIGIRGRATGEVLIPCDRYDGVALLALLDRFSNASTLH